MARNTLSSFQPSGSPEKNRRKAISILSAGVKHRDLETPVEG